MRRPDGWVTLKATNHPLHCLFPDDCVGYAFETGADAMLKALMGAGIHSNGLPEPVVSVAETMPGTWIFIPDEEVENET